MASNSKMYNKLYKRRKSVAITKAIKDRKYREIVQGSKVRIGYAEGISKIENILGF